jgi:hypothetical protein
MQLIFKGQNILEAHIVSGLLTSHGIDNHVAGHYLQGAVGDLPASDFAHVILHETADSTRAEELIADYEAGRLQSD